MRDTPENNLEVNEWAQNLASYTDTAKRPYIHVFDGAISDNLGLTPLLYYFRTGAWDVLTPDKHLKTKRLVLIVVDAKPADPEAVDQKPKIPKFMSVMVSTSTMPLSNYTVKTVQDFMNRFQETSNAGKNFERYQKLCDQVYAGNADREKCYDEYIAPYGGVMRPPYPGAYMIHVGFGAIRDKAFRDKVSGLPTDLQLKKNEVDSLIEAAKRILENSPEFQRLVKDLKAHRVGD